MSHLNPILSFWMIKKYISGQIPINQLLTRSLINKIGQTTEKDNSNNKLLKIGIVIGGDHG